MASVVALSIAKVLTLDEARRISEQHREVAWTDARVKVTEAYTSLIPAVPSPINSTRNASIVAPISAVIGTVIAVAIAWIVAVAIARIGVGVIRIAVSIVGRIVGVACVTSSVVWINSAVAWITSTVAWVAGIDVNGNALGGCFERHKHRQTKGKRAHKNGG
jgi:hypothetical protein